MTRRRFRLLKVQHFAEDAAPGQHDQPLRASSLRTAFEMQTQNVRIANRHAAGLRRNAAVDGFGAQKATMR